MRRQARSAARPTRSLPALASLALVLLLAGPGGATADDAVPIPEGYRMGQYRAPTPAEVPGATTIETATAVEMRASGEAVFLDVLPAPPRPAGRKADSEWKLPPHRSIPGSHWLPNVGRGTLSDRAAAYFRKHLKRLTGGDRSRPLVVYCLRHCWMSWNAAKRALEYGYRNVYWYPDGIDGWTEAGHALAEVRPEGEGPP